MTFFQYIYLYLLTVPVFFAIDMLWLGYASRGLYQTQLAHLLGPIQWVPAIIFQLLYIVGILIFAVVPALHAESLRDAILYGALFGFFAYATYDLTNLATLKDWPILITIVDMIWGVVLTSSVATASYLIGRAIFFQRMIATVLLLVCGVILVYVSVLFFISLILKRNDVADVGWGLGIFLVGLSSYGYMAFVSSKAFTFFQTFPLVLACIWGMRLMSRIAIRNSKKGEDYRYKVWRDTWGKWFYLRSYAQVYLLQGLLMLVVGYPLIHMAVFGGDGVSPIWTLLGVVFWCIGFYFEVVGDYELDRFISNSENKGKILMTGLWRYTRHPNYFGEVLMWWAIAFMVFPHTWGIFALIGPITISFLILKVSGVPMLEKKWEGNPLWEAYKEKTSIFFPMMPKD